MSYKRHQEGDSLDETELNDNVQAVVDTLNALDHANLIRNALRRDHLRSPVPDGLTDQTPRRALSVMCDITADIVPYRNTPFSTTGSDNSGIGPFDWQVFSTADPKPPYGPVALPGMEDPTTYLNAGWRIVDKWESGGPTAPSAYAADLLVDDVGLSMGDTGWAILAQFSADYIRTGELAQQQDPPYGADTSTDFDGTSIVIAIGVAIRDGDNVVHRRVIERSIRAYNQATFQTGDIGAWTLVRIEDFIAFEAIQGVTTPITPLSVFAVVAAIRTVRSENPINDPPLLRPLPPGAQIGNYNFEIDVVPVGDLHA